MKSSIALHEYIILYLDNGVILSKKYDYDDPIWDLNDKMQEFKCLTDIHKQVIKAVDDLGFPKWTKVDGDLK